MTAPDIFALGGRQDSEDDLSPAERRFVEGIRRLMPGYRFDMSYFAKRDKVPSYPGA
jgi:hypothetical protein